MIHSKKNSFYLTFIHEKLLELLVMILPQFYLIQTQNQLTGFWVVKKPWKTANQKWGNRAFPNGDQVALALSSTEQHVCVVWLSYRVVHRDVPLERDADRHEDGGAHRDALGRVQQVGEQLHVEVGEQAEAATEALQDAAEEVPAVEADERDDKQVEAVSHLIPGMERKDTIKTVDLEAPKLVTGECKNPSKWAFFGNM